MKDLSGDVDVPGDERAEAVLGHREQALVVPESIVPIECDHARQVHIRLVLCVQAPLPRVDVKVPFRRRVPTS